MNMLLQAIGLMMTMMAIVVVGFIVIVCISYAPMAKRDQAYQQELKNQAAKADMSIALAEEERLRRGRESSGETPVLVYIGCEVKLETIDYGRGG